MRKVDNKEHEALLVVLNQSEQSDVKMNKQEATQKIEVLEKELADLKKIVNSPEESFSEMFWALILQTDSIRLDKEKYPNSTFGFHGDKLLWEYNSKNAYLLLSYARIWSFLESNYNDVKSLIKSEVEEHFKCKGVTPCRGSIADGSRVEEHFKRKGVTPWRLRGTVDQFWSENLC